MPVAKDGELHCAKGSFPILGLTNPCPTAVHMEPFPTCLHLILEGFDFVVVVVVVVIVINLYHQHALFTVNTISWHKSDAHVSFMISLFRTTKTF